MKINQKAEYEIKKYLWDKLDGKIEFILSNSNIHDNKIFIKFDIWFRDNDISNGNKVYLYIDDMKKILILNIIKNGH